MNIFSPDSKFMQILTTTADMLFLNILYVLCCLPVFTIGAAQAGLYTGLRVLFDQEDDSSCFEAFFRGFRAGFGRITIVWIILAAVMATTFWSLVLTLLYHYSGLNAPVWMAVAGLCICILFQAVIGPFHARFSCTAGQLFRNGFLFILRYPLRSLLAAVLLWLPVVLVLFDMENFLRLTIVWTVFYYSFAFYIVLRLFKKPYERLEELANNANPQ